MKPPFVRVVDAVSLRVAPFRSDDVVRALPDVHPMTVYRALTAMSSAGLLTYDTSTRRFVPDGADIREHVVYRVYSPTGELLYVGCTCNLTSRLAYHSWATSWWRSDFDITTVAVVGRRKALAMERVAIRAEEPLLNKVGRRAA